jgi:hypothetical protein
MGLFGRGAEPPKDAVAPPKPVTLFVPVGTGVGIDPKARVVELSAVSENGIGAYKVRIPICVLKGLAGDVIAREANSEAEKLASGTAPQSKKIIVPGRG